jgi:hypothetical protein
MYDEISNERVKLIMKSRALFGLTCCCAALAGCVHTDVLNTGGLTLRLGKDQALGSTEAVAMAGGFDQMQASFSTSTFVVVGAEGGRHDYTAYIAGDWEQPESTAQGSFDLTDPMLHLNGGWAYVYGNHPIVQTQRTRARAGAGTRFIVQIAPDSDRIYLIPATGAHIVTIECLRTDPVTVHELNVQGHYVEVRDDGSLSEPRDVIASPQHGFVVKVREEAIAQNLEWFRETQWP